MQLCHKVRNVKGGRLEKLISRLRKPRLPEVKRRSAGQAKMDGHTLPRGEPKSGARLRAVQRRSCAKGLLLPDALGTLGST